jgi:TatD DNase family protein
MSNMKFVDIGANLLDERFTQGVYHGQFRHDPDVDQVLERAAQKGVTHIILTAGTLEDSREAVRTVRKWRETLAASSSCSLSSLFVGCTVGVHPTRCQQEFVDATATLSTICSSSTTTTTTTSNTARTADDVLHELLDVARDGIKDHCVVAIGEIGLDYDRLQFSSKDIQLEFLQRQLDVFLSDGGQASSSSAIHRLPLFLHNRSVGRDLLDVIRQRNETRMEPLRGVVHSFDDTLELAHAFIDLGLYIGLNGCSLKTTENLDVVRALPLTSILLETDCPYCEIKPTHAGFPFIQTMFEKRANKKFEMGKLVKGRSEPCQIVHVAEVIAGAKGISVEEVANACYQNSLKLYGWGDNSGRNVASDGLATEKESPGSSFNN